MLDRHLAELVARDLNTNPGLVEKDWHVTRAIAVLAAFDHGGPLPAFGGGTSLSKGWRLIKRFSEDIDFKVAMPAGVSRNQAKKDRSIYRDRVLAALTEAGFTLADEPFKRDENRFFSADLLYPSLFDAGPGLRPHIRVEMSMKAPTLEPVARSIASLIGMAQKKPPEVAAFLCVQPAETAADKLSALAWRVHARRRDSPDDDPTIIRHLHDLAALKATVTASTDFLALVSKAKAEDTGRGGEATASIGPKALFAGMLERLATDRLWAAEYRDYVRQVSYADTGELLDFDQALVAVKELAAPFGTEDQG